MSSSIAVKRRDPAQPPGLVLGTAGLGGVWGPIDEGASRSAIQQALEAGITRLDTAPAYARAEEIVGAALREYRGDRPFLSTKVGKLQADSASADTNDYHLAVMQKSLDRSREVLGRERLDLVFLHEPEKVPPTSIPRVIAWMERLRTDGIATQIGLGGVVPEAYHPALRAGTFDVVMSYNNLNAANLSGVAVDLPFFQSCGVTTYQGSPLYMGLLGDRYAEFQHDAPPWFDAQTLSRATRAKEVADWHDLGLAELAHRFLLTVAGPDYLVLGARTPRQLKETLAQFARGPLPEPIFNQLTQAIQ